MEQRYTTSSVAIIALIDLLTTKGLSPLKISERTGIPPELIQNPDIRISMKQLLSLWNLAIEISGDKALGLQLRKGFGKHTIHFVSTIASNSMTLAEGVEHWCNYARLICEPVRVSLRKSAGLYVVSYTNILPDQQCPSMVEHDFYSMLSFARKFSGKDINPVEVHFTHEAPPYEEKYQECFKCPIRFNQPENAFYFSEKTMNTKSITRNPHLQAILKKHAETQLEKYSGSDDLIDTIEEFITINLPQGDLDIEVVCKKLNMSRSTLYRKLKDHGVTFSGLLKNTRKKLALIYLKQKLNINQISYILGFTDSSTFQHAFKRWYGKSPGEFRKCLETEDGN